jgi:hypothetical protein
VASSSEPVGVGIAMCTFPGRPSGACRTGAGDFFVRRRLWFLQGTFSLLQPVVYSFHVRATLLDNPPPPSIDSPPSAVVVAPTWNKDTATS